MREPPGCLACHGLPGNWFEWVGSVAYRNLINSRHAPNLSKVLLRHHKKKEKKMGEYGAG